MSFRPVPGAALVALGLLAACAQTSGPTHAGPLARSGPATVETCAEHLLERGAPGVPLTGAVPLWTITNSGPATVVLRTPGEPALAIPYPPDPEGKGAMFFGDDRYSYRLELAPPGTSAKIRICQPTP